MEIKRVTYFRAGELADVAQWERITPAGLKALPNVTHELTGCRSILFGVHEITPLLSADKLRIWQMGRDILDPDIDYCGKRGTL